MSINAEALEAELRAINLWDRLFAESKQPDTLAKDACAARFSAACKSSCNCNG